MFWGIFELYVYLSWGGCGRKSDFVMCFEIQRLAEAARGRASRRAVDD